MLLIYRGMVRGGYFCGGGVGGYGAFFGLGGLVLGVDGVVFLGVEVGKGGVVVLFLGSWAEGGVTASGEVEAVVGWFEKCEDGAVVYPGPRGGGVNSLHCMNAPQTVQRSCFFCRGFFGGRDWVMISWSRQMRVRIFSSPMRALGDMKP